MVVEGAHDERFVLVECRAARVSTEGGPRADRYMERYPLRIILATYPFEWEGGADNCTCLPVCVCSLKMKTDYLPDAAFWLEFFCTLL